MQQVYLDQPWRTRLHNFHRFGPDIRLTAAAAHGPCDPTVWSHYHASADLAWRRALGPYHRSDHRPFPVVYYILKLSVDVVHYCANLT